MHLRFFLREALRSMRRSAAPCLAALATVVVTMLVLGAVIPIVQATHSAADSVRGRVEVDVYMKTNTTAVDEARVQHELLTLRHVKAVQFLSKQAAYAQQSRQNPQAYALLAANPLPDTFHVIPDQPADVLAVRAALTPRGPGGVARPFDAAIQSVSNRRAETEKILKATNLVTITAAVLITLLTLASVLLIANTIRLSLYSRRREVEVMKLVGATDWFIRWPFVIEGVLVGAVGALAAVAVLGLAKMLLLDPLAGDWSLLTVPRTVAFSTLVAVLMGAGVIVSALGSGLSLRRFLRV